MRQRGREREREMGMAHLAAAGPTSDSQRGHRLSACLRETPLPVRSQMAVAAAVYNNVLLIGPKRSSVVRRVGEPQLRDERTKLGI